MPVRFLELNLAMIFWLPVILIAILGLLLFSRYNKARKYNKLVAELKANWGRPLNNGRNFKLIGRYLYLFPGENDLSDATTEDLDLDGIFAYIDRTVSKPGQQYLYKNLHAIHANPLYFEQIESEVEALNADETLRRQIQIELSKLNSDDAYYLPDLFESEHASLFNPLVEAYIQVSAWFVLALIAALVFIGSPVYIIMLMAALVTNTIIYFINKNKIYSYIHSLPQLLILINISNWMAKTAYIATDNNVITSLKSLAKLKKSLNIISYQSKTANDPTDLTYLVMEWVKMFLLLEARTFINSVAAVNKCLNEINVLYEFVAQVDVAISIQSVRDGLPYYCKPDIAPHYEDMIAEGLYHPLVEGCVANTMRSNCGQGILITGSNMSGKTTFIRAMAVNAVLAQTLHTSLTTKYQAPPLNILTSINMADSIDEGQSYFQAEALSVLNIVKRSAAGNNIKSLVIIDEIFRGTNTIERIAAAKAVLSHLVANNNFVFVSTHDLELAKLLGNEYAVYSFEELAGEDRLVFDYKIKPGLLKNKNGIAVLKGLGYPDSIINDANIVGKQLWKKYDI